MSELVSEVGDLRNIKPYHYSISSGIKFRIGKFIADTPKGQAEVEVIVNIMPVEHKNKLEASSVFEIDDPRVQIFNAAFTVGGEDVQFTKADYSSYLRIVTTVVQILKEILTKLETTYYKPILMITSTSKDGIAGTEDTKLRYYRAVMNSNLPEGYRMSEGNFNNSKVLVLQKIK